AQRGDGGALVDGEALRQVLAQPEIQRAARLWRLGEDRPGQQQDEEGGDQRPHGGHDHYTEAAASGKKSLRRCMLAGRCRRRRLEVRTICVTRSRSSPATASAKR